MTDRHANPDAKPAAPERRRLWVRPTLTRLAAADAEVGTRNTGPDGSFSVS